MLYDLVNELVPTLCEYIHLIEYDMIVKLCFGDKWCVTMVEKPREFKKACDQKIINDAEAPPQRCVSVSNNSLGYVVNLNLLNKNFVSRSLLTVSHCSRQSTCDIALQGEVYRCA